MKFGGESKVFPIGSKWGRLTIDSNITYQKRATAFMCVCECGDRRLYFARNLRTQKEPMCPDCRTISRPAKGMSGKHPLFNIWKAMIQRCYNPKHTWYHLYGGRGIKMCQEWRSDFLTFAKDMGERPSLGHTVDRWPDNDGDYCPENTRWANQKQQQNNARNNIMIELNGEVIPVKYALDDSSVDYATLVWRLKRGWDTDLALKTLSRNPKNKGVPKNKSRLTGKSL